MRRTAATQPSDNVTQDFYSLGEFPGHGGTNLIANVAKLCMYIFQQNLPELVEKRWDVILITIPTDVYS